MNREPQGLPKMQKDMTSNSTLRAGQWTRTLGSDLSRYFGSQSLLKLVLDSVQSVDELLPPLNKRTVSEFRPQMMLTLLTYSYASTIYGSKDIESEIERDRTIRYICARTFPDWQILRRFRRTYRDLIHQCLVNIFKQMWALRFDEGEADYVGYEWFESELIEQVNKAASERLDLAVLMDGAESDL